VSTEILKLLEQRDEPLTILQISYATSYSKRHIDDILNRLKQQNKVKQKELCKNNSIFYLNNQFHSSSEILPLATKVETLMRLEGEELNQERELQEIEKGLKEIKL
jgi:DNA-binding IclR family transcriptional regulator